MPLIKLVAERRQKQVPPGLQPPENAASWYRIENSVEDADETDIYVYDSIGGWFGLYADDLIRDLKEVTTSRINLRLNSPGGSVFEGIAIANALRAHPASVTVYVDGLAASIASVVMLAGDRVIMRPQSQVMVHAASGGCYGDSAEMSKMAELLEFQTRNIAEAYSERTGRPVDEFLSLMAAETWFTAKEAVEIGLADEAMPMKPKKSDEECEPMPASASALMNRSWDLSMYRYAGREAAPGPAIKASAIAGAVITAEMANDLQAIADTTTPVDPASEKVVVDISSPEFVNQMRELIREVMRAEAAAEETVTDGTHSTSVEDVSNHEPAPEFSVGDRVRVLAGRSHEEGEESEEMADEGVVKEIGGTAFGVLFDGEDEIHRWYTADELTSTDTGPPEEESPPHNEATDPDTGDDWDAVVALFHAPTTSPSADDVFAHLKEVW